jgi:PilZ domain
MFRSVVLANPRARIGKHSFVTTVPFWYVPRNTELLFHSVPHDASKRDKERIELLGALKGEVMVYQPTTVHQISKGGMQVETSFALQVDSLHDFRLTIGERSIVVKGRVAHSRISEFFHDGVTYRSGVEFIEPSEPVASVISEFVEELKQERTPQ